MRKHIRTLGLASASDYLGWCRKAGVAASLDKTTAERAEELSIPAKLEADRAEKARVANNPRRFLAAACVGGINPDDVTRPVWREVATAIANSKPDEKERESLKSYLLYLEDVSDLVFGVASQGRQQFPYVEGLIRLHERRGMWLRQVEDWRPDRHNVRRQFSSLARHLLARYEVPVFLDSGWLRGDRGAYRFRDWFIHVGLGKNIRTAKTPYPMTRMSAHHFMGAPDAYSIEGALMLGDIRAMGGGPRLTEALIATRLGQRVESEKDKRAFWLSVYRFFIDNPMLDLRHAGPIVDFLAYQKYETQEVMVGPGRAERRPPPQPNLSMSRRTPDSLLRQVDAWHGELRILRAKDRQFWKPCGIKPLDLETGSRERPVTWTTHELMSGQELVEEGRAMRHCVSTYASSCAAGRCSIWSLRRQEKGDEPRRRLTVEIDARGQMVEARGLANRWPTDAERNALELWMRQAGLRPGAYLHLQ
jgi:hypothetical protein